MAVWGALSDITRFLTKGPGGVNIDNRLFQLHYRATTALLLASSALLCTSSLFGNPVTCHHADPDRISGDIINTYCWVTSTYTLPHQLAKSQEYPFSDIPYHGLGTHRPKDEKRFHTYYQWVPFVLFLQGMSFYLPHWIWRISEGKRLSSILQGMVLPTMDKEERSQRLTTIVHYLMQTLGSYNGYFLRYICCELLNIIVVISNIFVTDKFLGGYFLSYGPRMLAYFAGQYDPKQAPPMTETFPKLTKCNFQLVGASGTTQSIDNVCVMALNILNEKIYLLLWFWFVALAVVSVMAFGWRVVMMSATALRVPMLQASARLADQQDLEEVAERVRLGDFFLFSLMAKNMDGVAFRELMAELAKSFGSRPEMNGAAPRAPPLEAGQGQTLVKRHVPQGSAAD